MNLTAKNLFQLEGQNPYMTTLGEMGDIYYLCQFGWYEWMYFCQNTASFPYQKEELGRCLGPTKNEGNEMSQWIIQKKWPDSSTTDAQTVKTGGALGYK